MPQPNLTDYLIEYVIRYVGKFDYLVICGVTL